MRTEVLFLGELCLNKYIKHIPSCIRTSLKRAAEDGAECAGSFTHKPWRVCLSTHLFQENILSMPHSWFIYSKAGSIVAVLLKTHRRDQSGDKDTEQAKHKRQTDRTRGQLGRGERQGLNIFRIRSSLIFMIGVSNWWIVSWMQHWLADSVNELVSLLVRSY